LTDNFKGKKRSNADGDDSL